MYENLLTISNFYGGGEGIIDCPQYLRDQLNIFVNKYYNASNDDHYNQFKYA